MRFRGVAAALFVILVWGITFVNTRALLEQFSALEIQVLRLVLGWVALACWSVFGGAGKSCRIGALLHWKEERWFFFMGIFGVAIYQLLENCAIHYTNASNVSILVCMCPLLTAVVSRMFPGSSGRPPLPVSFFVGFAVAIAGVAMVSMNGISEFHFNPLGDFLAAMAMLSWVVYSNMVDFMNEKGYSQTFVIRRMFFWSLVVTVPFIVYGITDAGRVAMDGSFAINLDLAANADRFTHPINYVNLGFLGVLASAACFVLWNFALGVVGTVRCTIGLYLLPAITVVFAYLFLGEALTLVSAIGAALVLAGVVMSGWKLRS